MQINKIFIASDHAGFHAKEQAKKALATLGYEAVDLGTHSAEASVDYPDFAGALADKILAECEACARSENFKESSSKNSAATAENSEAGGNENFIASINGCGNFNAAVQCSGKNENFNVVKSGDGKNFDADANTTACASIAAANASKDKILNSTNYGIYGVLICGTGIGISIAANRHAHIRCALCHDATSARLAREHNDANVLAFGERLMGALVIGDMIRAFFSTDFAGGRHIKRVAKLGACGSANCAHGFDEENSIQNSAQNFTEQSCGTNLNGRNSKLSFGGKTPSCKNPIGTNSASNFVRSSNYKNSLFTSKNPLIGFCGARHVDLNSAYAKIIFNEKNPLDKNSTSTNSTLNFTRESVCEKNFAQKASRKDFVGLNLTIMNSKVTNSFCMNVKPENINCASASLKDEKSAIVSSVNLKGANLSSAYFRSINSVYFSATLATMRFANPNEGGEQ
jgi:sugar-phosphate isomerase, RpiB/LacA/LacB family